jgi:hypothetical protein
LIQARNEEELSADGRAQAQKQIRRYKKSTGTVLARN